ncbi:Hydroxymethylpyrimidine ABC transporter, substrate-binding component [Marinobacterium lacunae]|uniref:Hydroxymethylpyrimidine ABC transporter, substrate-binding component n=1 Tax=Marinobacterium lacunae TaxID=1232683 RepID=A0A081FVJ5_9GAMM|nr:ABC transporter substrate-binding protein [Marinobacterium lacunae]KEA62550.1 Hydroxymethylpyrimidine ABC transporter, substrate-binding component [Marinobacterium lacunae]
MKRLSTLILAMLFSAQALAADKVELLLDWFINPDHGPLIVAQQKGYFAEQGLEVSMVEPADPSMPPKLVAAGKADMAINYQPQLHQQIDEGLPLVRVGTLVATPLNSLVVLKDGPVKSIADLKGRKVGYSVSGFEDALLHAMLEKNGLTLKDIELVNVNWSLSPSLISGQVDAVIGAFRNFELNQMDIEGHPGRAFFVEEEGVPAYDELILVINAKDRGDDRYSRFMKAVEKATQFIVNHPQAAWQSFVSYKPDELDNELNKRAWADTLTRFALRPAALDTERYQRFGEFMQQQGLTKATPSVDTYATAP